MFSPVGIRFIGCVNLHSGHTTYTAAMPSYIEATVSCIAATTSHTESVTVRMAPAMTHTEAASTYVEATTARKVDAAAHIAAIQHTQ